MTEFDPVAFGKSVGDTIREALAPLLKRIEELEARQPEKGEKGEKGDPGQDAPPVELDVAEVVKELLAADGVKQYLKLEVEAYMAENPPPAGRDGKDGEPGPRGEKGDPGRDGAGIADLLIDRDGNLTATFTDGRMKSLGVVVGKDGAPGAPGRDGADFSDVSIDYDGERTITIKGRGGEIVKRVPIPLDRGYWSPGNSHEKGDVVTHNGVAFIAKRDTTAEPKTENSDDWRILARKGRDGKDGRNGIDKTGPVKL